MRKALLKKRGLFGDSYELIEVHESGDAFASLLTLVLLPVVIVAVIGFHLFFFLIKFVVNFAVDLTIAGAVRFHHGIDDTFDELHKISPVLSGAVVTGVIIWSLLLLLKALGVGG